MTPSVPLLELDDNHFAPAWSDMAAEERSALPADVRSRCFERYNKIMGPVLSRVVPIFDRGEPGVPRAAGGGAPRGDRPQLPRVWVDDAAVPTHSPALIKGLLGLGECGMVYGDSSTGKTFLVIDLLWHIVLGLRWRDHRTSPALGVYIAAEAGRSILRRFVASRDRYVGDARESRVPLAIVTRAVNVLAPAELEQLILELRAIADEAGAELGIVVLDTASRSMPGANENAAEDMTRFIAALDHIRAELRCAVLVVHHSGKDASKGARGHTSLYAALDLVIRVADREAIVEKVRDGVAGQRYPFNLELVQLGRDQDDDPITTCVVVPADEPSSMVSGPRPIGLGANQERALTILRQLLRNARSNVEARGDDPENVGILTTGWRAECERRGIDRKRWAEVRAGLEERGMVRFDGPHAYPIEAV